MTQPQSLAAQSPVQVRKPSGSTRQTKSRHLSPPSNLSGFVKKNLRCDETVVIVAKAPELAKLGKLVSTADKNNRTERVCELMNNISSKIFKTFTDRSTPARVEELHFFNHERSIPAFHPWDRPDKKVVLSVEAEKASTPIAPSYKAMPDLLVTDLAIFNQYKTKKESTTTAGNYRNFSWHFTVSCIEVESGKNKEGREKQLNAYLNDTLQSRPDLIGVYGVYAGSKTYQIMWEDCSGCRTSLEYGWETLSPLVAYIHSLYYPPDTHQFRQTKIMLASPSVFTFTPPEWKFHGLPRTFRQTIVGPPHTRMTRIFEQIMDKDDPQGAPIVIKECFSQDTNATEMEMLRQVHSNGDAAEPIPLCIRALELVTDGLRTPPWDDSDDNISDEGINVTTNHRRRDAWKVIRLLCLDTGDPLDRCPSVRDFWMILFDAMEGHRHALRRGVLHRDISIGNILINIRRVNTEHWGVDDMSIFKNPEDLERMTANFAEVVTIRKLLSAKNIEPMAILIDFHLSSKWPRLPEDQHELRTRTGTGAFWARAVQNGFNLTFLAWRSFPKIPTMPVIEQGSPLHERLLECFSEAEYHNYTTLFNASNISLATEEEPCVHYPHHDVESFFMVGIIFLLPAILQAKKPSSPQTDPEPEPELPDTTLVEYQKVFPMLGFPEFRSNLMMRDSAKFCTILHPGLASQGEIFASLAEQVFPEWAMLKGPIVTDDHRYHDHRSEAFRRLLYRHVRGMWGDDGNGDPLPRKLLHQRNCPDVNVTALLQRSRFTIHGLSSMTPAGASDNKRKSADDPTEVNAVGLRRSQRLSAAKVSGSGG